MTPKLEQFSFQDQKVLMRVDFNVPLNDQFEITDDSRIRAALPSINHILSEGGAVIIMSHLGRPKNGPEEAFSLKHIVARLSELTNKEVQFANDCMGEEAANYYKAINPSNVVPKKLQETNRFSCLLFQGSLSFTYLFMIEEYE